MSITELAIKRPILFVVFFIVLGGMAVFSYQKLKYELLPTLATPTITILTAYPGALPDEVENSVTKKIEDAVSGVSKSKKISSISSDNLSVVMIDFNDDANQDQAIQDVQRAVNQVLSEFPAGVKAPVLEKFNVNDLPVLKLAVVAETSPSQLYDLVKDHIKPRLAQMKGVGNVKILGGAPKEIKIFVKQDQLISRGISINEIATAIQRANQDFPIGTIKDNDQQFSVKLGGKLASPKDISEVMIKTYPDGSNLYVKDVADVKDGNKEEEIKNRLNGISAIALFISKQNDANAANVSKTLRSELTELEKEYSDQHLQFNVAKDSSEFTLDSAHQVYDDLGIAVLLVALVMLIFLHSLRNALIIMVSIPASLFTTVILMFLLGYSLNLMTLLAVSLVVGVLVDDSIVVLENIYHHLEMGKDKKKAALDGRSEIGFAALSITLVDVVVFLPMSMVPGLVGSLVKEFSLVIVTSTLSSLLVSFTLTPMIASRFSRLEELNPKSIPGKIGLWFEKQVNLITENYKKILHWGLSHKSIVAILAISTLGGALMLVTSNIVGTEFLPGADKGELSVFIDLAPGSKLQETDSTVQVIAKEISKLPVVVKLFSNSGYQNDGFNEKYNSNIATINVTLVPTEKRQETLPTISRRLRNMAMQVPGVKARVSPIGLFGANEAPVQLLITGENRDSIKTAANKILAKMKSISGIVSPRLSSEEGKPELFIEMNRKKMSNLGLDITTIGGLMRMGIYGEDNFKIRENGKERDSRIQFGLSDRSHTQQLSGYPFPVGPNQSINLNQMGQVSMHASASALERRNKQASITILSNVSGRPVGNVGEDIQAAVEQMHLSPSIKVLYEGDLEKQSDSFTDLGFALLASVVLIYLIMVSLYNNWSYPFIILLSIPLALSGSLLALALTDKSINVFSIFGLIMMMGLVAKNGILLVDKTNHLLNGGMELEKVRSALIEAGGSRLRPILMTTLAMIIGMLPLALAKGASSAFSSGLAWVLIGGLSSSMLLTLIVVPVVYFSLVRLKTLIPKMTIAIFGKKATQVTIIFFAFININLFTIEKLQAQTVTGLSLQNAVEMGLSANNQIKIADIEALKTQYGLKEAFSYRYPQVGMTMDYYRNIKPSIFFLPTFGINDQSQIVYDASKLQAIPVSAKNAYNATVNIAVPLFNAEVSGNIKNAKLSEELSNANVEMNRWELADQIRKAYFNVLLTEENMLLADSSLQRAKQNLSDSKILMQKGYAMATDTINAWSNAELIKINLNKAKVVKVQTENFLKFLIGLPLTENVVLSGSVNDRLLSQTPLVNTDNVDIIAHRPDFMINQAQIKLALQQINIEKTKSTPKLSFISQYSIQTQAENFNFDQYNYANSFFVGVQLTVPLFNGFRTNSRVKQSKLALQQMELKYSLLETQLNMDIQNELLDIDDCRQKVDIRKKVADAKAKVLDLIRIRWMDGFAKYTDVADAELELIKAQNESAQGEYDLMNALATYYKMVGGII